MQAARLELLLEYMRSLSVVQESQGLFISEFRKSSKQLTGDDDYGEELEKHDSRDTMEGRVEGRDVSEVEQRRERLDGKLRN